MASHYERRRQDKILANKRALQAGIDRQGYFLIGWQELGLDEAVSDAKR